MSWWQILLIGLSGYFVGVSNGRNQISDDVIERRLKHMEDLILQEQEKTELVRSLWIEAEQKAETWERRYNSLIPEEKEM